jgi:hypothetical protein
MMKNIHKEYTQQHPGRGGNADEESTEHLSDRPMAFERKDWSW